tara:strand:+ start:328 stop:1695 length:1368 start_codon:yes stop_codon:yes gene_type:complete
MNNSSIEDKMAQAFDAFEPEVQGDWSSVESKLDAQVVPEKSDVTSRIRAAERFAIGATAVAAGLTLWISYPFILDFFTATGHQNEGVASSGVIEEVASIEHSVRFSENLEEGVWSENLKMDSEAQLAGSHRRMVFRESSARTSNSVKMSSVESDQNGEGSMILVDVENEDSDENELFTSVNVKANHASVGDEDDKEVELISVKMTSSVQEACEGTEVDFALDKFMDTGSILWNFGDGTFSQESTPSHVFDRPGSYDITVSVRSHENGYIRTKSIEDMIVVRPKPEARLDWEFDVNTGNGVQIHLVDATESASSSTWVMTELGLNGSRITIQEPGAYPVNLIVSNAFGCQDVAVGNIELGDRHVAGAPAMFSPNGDGRYDEFLPEAANDAFKPWLFSVFDVDGQLVFESESAQKAWKGQIQGGGRVRIGERYFWNLEVTNPDGSKSIHSDVVRIDG